MPPKSHGLDERKQFTLQLLGLTSSRELLKMIFHDRTLRNSSYSLRAFARDTGLSISTLSSLFRGHSKLSLKRVEKLCLTLKLDPLVKNYVLLLVRAETTSAALAAEDAWDKVREYRHSTMFCHFMDDQGLDFKWTWLHACLMLLARLDRLPHGAYRFPSYIPYSESQLTQALQELLEAGWLVPAENGLAAPLGYLHAPKPGKQIRELHRHMLEQNLYALEKVPVEERMFAQNFITLRQEDYSRLSEELARIIREKCDRLENRDEHDAVFSLSWQLVPLYKAPRVGSDAPVEL